MEKWSTSNGGHYTISRALLCDPVDLENKQLDIRHLSLPPNQPIEMNQELQRLLSDADRALGRLDGVTSVLPNSDLFVAMYVRHEAVLSSQRRVIQQSNATLSNDRIFSLHCEMGL